MNRFDYDYTISTIIQNLSNLDIKIKTCHQALVWAKENIREVEHGLQDNPNRVVAGMISNSYAHSYTLEVFEDRLKNFRTLCDEWARSKKAFDFLFVEEPIVRSIVLKKKLKGEFPNCIEVPFLT